MDDTLVQSATDGQGSYGQWSETEMTKNNTAEQEDTFDLSMLWQMLERHKDQMEEKEESGMNINHTWELVIVQGVLLALLVLITVSWALCCRRRSTNPTVVEALRKLSNTPSKDLPPSYSVLDLFSQGSSVHDYLNPPPEYPAETLQYLDLEAGHRRLSRLSFGSSDGVPARLGRLSVASCNSCASERSNRFSVSSEASSSSRRDSRASTTSRVSFSEDCSARSIRRLSSNTLFDMRANSNSSSRKSSSSSDGSRRSSLISKVHRKMGSNNSDSFIVNLDNELQQNWPVLGILRKQQIHQPGFVISLWRKNNLYIYVI
eukprot:TRINITY_DN24644_c0_g1_i1.p1 TRINITY_DN24644_c0_g1~~TRINITY_DN24644_c0_g1_i1.p1  ORF type:complete len:318 (-),score=49.49 TRINITY_DN24644_c0_g1_i1:35-988(-)